MSTVNYKTIFGSLMIFFIGYILEYCLNAFVSYHIGSALFGDFSLALRLMMVAGPLYLLGLPATVIKYVSQFRYAGDKKSTLQFLKWSIFFTLKSIIFFPFFVVILIITFLLDFYHIYSLKFYYPAVYFLFLYLLY